MVLVKRLILYRYKGILEVLRHLICGNDLPVLSIMQGVHLVSDYVIDCRGTLNILIQSLLIYLADAERRISDNCKNGDQPEHYKLAKDDGNLSH